MSKIIKAFKFSTGETIIAEVVNAALFEQNTSQSNTYTIKKPYILDLRPVSHNQVGMVMIPWLLANQNSDEEIQVLKNHLIIEPYVPDYSVESYYMKQISNIDLSTVTSF